MTVQTVEAAEVVLSGLDEVGHGTVAVSGPAAGLDRLPPARAERAAPARPRSASAGRAGVIGFVGPRDDAPPVTTPSRLRRVTRALRPHLGTIAGVTILGVLLWRLGTGVFLDGLRRIDATTLLVGLGIGLLTTGFSAWRWALVARRLGLGLPLLPAIADYYRSLFLNAALPGGVLGDVHRAVRHGKSAGDMGRGVRAVVLERAAGQVALIVVGGAMLLTLPSPALADARRVALMAALAAVGVVAVLVAVRMNRAPSAAARRTRALRAVLTEARGALLSRENLPGVALSSVVVLSGHLGMFVVAARVAGSSASVAELLPIAVLALLAMGLPLNVGGWGPREGVTAWAFGAAGLGASMGLSVAVVYGVLSFVAALPGAAVLVVRYFWSPTESAATAESAEPAASAPASPSVSIEKYAPKDSAKLASNAFPFSAEPSEGRPMTPESV
ncbi:lysylphosphatidylglycerol synthase transmembrane domain-containing protein [Streptomyces sp. WI04-05B]|nr:lysylphosphatidylglycerol synthase transmembrane domain-containing protein [Streptomyces sp. WI04-05B]MDX2586669.1 lysylphosphatidylglycerol synthase transmembrane domain-containing protein [Streptomyces sp. WI04-05A]MDX3746233.1 lysylphosphatidylglycerol synthase transmembrane domain-containing protein [Streptomyces sp. AK08-02]